MDGTEFVRKAYDAVQTLGSTSRTVGKTALTVEKAAEVVRDVASVVGILCLITGIGSAAAAAMGLVDAAAIKTAKVADAIYHEAAKLSWAALDMLPSIHDVQVRHTLAPGAKSDVHLHPAATGPPARHLPAGAARGGLTAR